MQMRTEDMDEECGRETWTSNAGVTNGANQGSQQEEVYLSKSNTRVLGVCVGHAVTTDTKAGSEGAGS